MHTRSYQIFPDITLNLLSYMLLLIINIPFLSKFWNIKRVAGYLFCTGRNVTHIIISMVSSDVANDANKHKSWNIVYISFVYVFKNLSN